MKKLLWISSASTIALWCSATAALAQSAEAVAAPVASAAEADPSASQGAGNDIVVTAQRRDQNLQDVPLAVSVIGTETLQRQQINTTQGLLRMFPNVSGAQGSGTGVNNYAIRGLSNAETAATFDSPVGTYIDGVYLGRLNANNFAMFDVKRIEVLRGPQGTLFGRNTTGGAINIILLQPADKLGASFEGSYGSFNAKLLRASLDAPLSDHIRTRISGFWTDEDGWVKNLTTGGHNNAHNGWGVRGAVSVDFSPSVTWDVAIDRVHDANSLIPHAKVNGEWVSRSGLGPLGSIVTGNKGSLPGNRVFNDTTGVTSHLNIDTDVGKISLITGYRHLLTQLNLDFFNSPSALGGYDSLEDSTHEQFSQEANIAGSAFDGKLDYTAGVFYFNEDNVNDYAAVLNLTSIIVPYDRTLYNTTRSFAGYGQFDWHVTPQLTFTAGGRWTSDDKRVHYQDNNNARVAASARTTDADLIAAGIPLREKSAVFTPRFALSYEPNENLTLFASATRGFKSGGWNIRSGAVNQLGAFGSEKIWSYEGGLRSQWFDHKLTFNLTGFYGKTNGLQIATASGAASGSAPVFPVGNFADLESYGLEAEATIKPARGLSIFANAGYNHTEYAGPTAAVLTQQANCRAALGAGVSNSNCGNGIITLQGNIAIPFRAPKFTGTLGFSYEVPVSGDWNIVPSGSVRYVSSFNVNAAALPTTYDDGYTLVAGAIGLENPEKGLRFTAGCENCTNTNYLVTVISGFQFWSPPRRWTATAAIKF